MGCWNETDMISNLHIRAGQRIVMYLLVDSGLSASMCYSTGLFNPCPIPIYGTYDDYGGIENAHGPLLKKLVGIVKADLLEMPEGENPYHDRAVSKQDFDIDALMQAECDDRLNIIDFSKFHRLQSAIKTVNAHANIDQKQQEELDRLYVKLAQPSNVSKSVRKVFIHGDIFDAILEKWYLDSYKGEGQGNVGYRNSYTYIYYKDAVATIPQYIEAIKESIEKIPDSSISGRLASAQAAKSQAGQFLSYFDSHDYPGGIQRVSEGIDNYIQNKDWDGLAVYAEEILKTLWIHLFLEHTRKPWCVTTGRGGQNQEHLGYTVLIDAMSAILKSERHEDDEDDEDPVDDVAALSIEEVQPTLAIIQKASDVMASLTK